MFRHSTTCRVVFTQAYPFLASFAHRHFLPEHPLSNHPLWLDENDFALSQSVARRRGVPSPLRINPLSHHPELSPYARRRGGGKGRPSRRVAAAAAAKKSEESNRTAAATAVRPGSTSVDSTDRTRRRLHEANVKQRVLAANQSPPLPQQISVPLCSVAVQRHIYLYNLDQMKMDATALPTGLFYPADQGDSPSRTNEAGDTERRQIQSLSASATASPWEAPPSATGVVRGGDDCRRAQPYPYQSTEQRMKAAMQALQLTDSPPLYRMDTSTSATAEERARTEYISEQSFLQQEGARMLRARFPNPSWAVGGETGAAAYSIKSGRPYSSNLQADLQRLRHLHGYHSLYWGTVHQWRAVGATPQYKEREHLVYLPIVTKLVHISFIDGAEELLQNAFISAKSGLFSPVLGVPPDVLRRVREASLAPAGPEAGSPTHPLASPFPTASAAAATVDALGVMASQPTPLTQRTEIEGRYGESGLFQQAVLTDMRVHKYRIPLYFSGLQVLSHRLALKPQAQGIDLHALKRQQHTQSLLGVSDAGLFGHAAQPPAGSVTFDNETVLGSSAASAGTPGLSDRAALTPVATRHYYHLSQVHFPKGFTIPLCVVTAELEANPGVALHGVTGHVLAFPELTVESVRDSYPEVAAVLLEAAPVANASPPASDRHGNEANGKVNKGGETQEEAGVTAETPDLEADEVDLLDLLQGHTMKKTDAHKSRNTEGVLAASSSTPPPSVTTGTVGVGNTAETARKERLLAMSDDEFGALVRARVDPTNVSGRSLWFLAEDVLKLDGIVDVNATPVEVTDLGQAVGGLDSASGATVSSRALYNVECLLNPEEGLRLVNQRADALH